MNGGGGEGEIQRHGWPKGGGMGGNPPQGPKNLIPPKAENLCSANPPQAHFFTLSLGQENFPLKFPPHSPPRPKDFVPPQGLVQLFPPKNFFWTPPVAPTHGHVCPEAHNPSEGCRWKTAVMNNRKRETLSLISRKSP